MKRKVTLFWRWDKYEVPLPFSEIVIAFGEPFRVPAGIDAVELEKKTAELKARMDQIHQTAKSASG